MTVYTCTRDDLTQRLAVVDLDSQSGAKRAISLLPESVELVYSDPPWNPGNATYWRTYAKQSACPAYSKFLDRLVSIYAECQERGARNVLVEQAINPKHFGMLLEAVDRNPGWRLPYQRHYEVCYSRPKRPNAILHWGHEPLSTDPTGLDREPMTLRAMAGTQPLPAGTWVVDPCMGLGMTSRMAHMLGMNCFGTELNPARLAKTIDWLRKQGYQIEESA